MGIFNDLFKKSTQTVLNLRMKETVDFFKDFFTYDYGQQTVHKLIRAYAENPIVYMIVNKIAGVTSSLDRVLLDQNGNQIESGDVYELLKRPNPSQNEQEFRKEIDVQLLASGNAFVRYRRGIGMGAEMEVLKSQCIDIEVNGYNEVTAYIYEINNRNERIPVEEIIHMKYDNVVDYENEKQHYGFSPLEAAYKIVVASNEIFTAEASLFKNRGVAGVLTNDSEVPLLPKDREALQKDFNDEVGGADKFNRVKISNQKLRYLQMGMSPTDLQLIDNQLNKLRFLCGVYGIDSKLLGDGANSTYNNVKEAQKNAYIDTYLPQSKKVDNDLIRFLNKEYSTQYEYKVDRSKIEVLKEVRTLEDLILEKINEQELTLEELQAIQRRQNTNTNEEL